MLTIELSLGEGSSLKDKRHVIKSALDMIRHKFNVSAAEVDHLDSLRRAELAFSAVSNSQQLVNAMLDKVMEVFESDPRVDIIDSRLKFL